MTTLETSLFPISAFGLFLVPWLTYRIRHKQQKTVPVFCYCTLRLKPNRYTRTGYVHMDQARDRACMEALPAPETEFSGGQCFEGGDG